MVAIAKGTQLLLYVKSDILEYVIDKVQETLDTMVEYTAYQYKRKFGDITPYEKEWIRLHINKELMSAFEVWTKSTDTLLDFNIAGDVNSIITFACVVRRENQNYMFNTTVVWTALKFRNNYFNYFTKTTLPHTKRKEISKSLDKDILKLVARKNLENKIYLTELNLNRVRCNILMREQRTDYQIYQQQKSDWHKIVSMQWEEAVAKGYDEFYQDEEEFYLVKHNAPKFAINGFKEIHITRAKEQVEKISKELKELKDTYKHKYKADPN